jgi:hypothetical protein
MGTIARSMATPHAHDLDQLVVDYEKIKDIMGQGLLASKRAW